MVIFLDTSAIYALADRNDPNHRTLREKASYRILRGHAHSYRELVSTR